MKHLDISIFYKNPMDFLQPTQVFSNESCVPKASFLSEGLDDSEAFPGAK